MKYFEITVNTTSEGQELVADILWDYSVYGVAICDTNDILELISYRKETYDYLDESLEYLKPSTLVKGYVEEEKTISEIEQRFLELQKNACIELGSLEIVKRIVDGDDWIEIWRKHYKPMEIGNIVVCPNWIECNTDKKVVKIDTNNAFGTGEHETTSMVLEKLQDYIFEGANVIDVGTGSGILGIACCHLGAKTVYMTDIDQVAVDSAIHNAEVNGVLDKCVIVKSDLLGEAKGNCDLIVANITADILLRLTGTVSQYMKTGSKIILSGILNARLSEVKTAYEGIGLKSIDSKTKGEWSCLVMEKL